MGVCVGGDGGRELTLWQGRWLPIFFDCWWALFGNRAAENGGRGDQELKQASKEASKQASKQACQRHNQKTRVSSRCAWRWRPVPRPLSLPLPWPRPRLNFL